ncbi:unnamed protein product [Arabidopsis thaliana]|uniref:(thale cress) hypothetical protein n=1 Tax=Arabidopsis thaliana TaxID=3702 RepID=A0A7G2EVE7_ARATH|nr:unnamed protein product [Arabidopsis thaliana]
MSEEVPIESYCMVICGEWECSDIQEWYFEINKILMSRIVPIPAGMNLSSLEDIVLKEFMNKDFTFGTPRFSYLPSNIMDYTTGKKTPPILITREVGLKFFIEMFGRNKGLNLFVTFSEMIEIGNSRRKNVREEDVAGSSVMKSKKTAISSSCEGLARSDDDIGWEAPTAGSKTPKIPTTQDDDAVIAEVEVLEIMYNRGDEQLHSSGSEEKTGSNAPEIMFSPRVARIQEDKDCNDGRDEEFNIPPLFDDTEYERDEIPELDIEDDEKGIYKGRVYASKQDCQISLAIHAIKEQFYFKQSRTKRHYFVITCADENCQWRIMSHEMKTCGYYLIRKADLEHTCNIETRGQYMKMATSRVIASVYKAKFSKFSEGPVPLDLQQMVLEDLRVTTSYETCWRAKEKVVEEVFGIDDDSYKSLEAYLYVLKLANPGTVTDIKTETQENGFRRFLYLFLAFGASIDGFRYLRRVIVVDGTHLTSKYKGVLLTATGQEVKLGE